MSGSVSAAGSGPELHGECVARSVGRLVRHLEEHDPGGVLGVYLFGSAALDGLRPDSDLDVLVVTERSLSIGERSELLDVLLRYSGRRATVEPGRPLEITTVVRNDLVPWTYPPRCDFLYGEWLRTEFGDGMVPEPHPNPDLAVLVTTLQQRSLTLRGPGPADLLEPVPPADLRRSLRDSLPPLLDDLEGDERNVLLTLARMVVTLDTGRIFAKDEAARRILPSLPEPYQAALLLAVDGYLGEVADDWSSRRADARDAAGHLAERIRAVAGQAAPGCGGGLDS